MEGLHADMRVKIGESEWLAPDRLVPPQALVPDPRRPGEVQTLRLYRDNAADQADARYFRVDFLDAPHIRRLDLSALAPGPGACIRVLFSPEFACSRLECQIAFGSAKTPLAATGLARLFGDEWEVFLFESDWSSWLRITLTAYPA